MRNFDPFWRFPSQPYTLPIYQNQRQVALMEYDYSLSVNGAHIHFFPEKGQQQYIDLAVYYAKQEHDVTGWSWSWKPGAYSQKTDDVAATYRENAEKLKRGECKPEDYYQGASVEWFETVASAIEKNILPPYFEDAKVHLFASEKAFRAGAVSWNPHRTPAQYAKGAE